MSNVISEHGLLGVILGTILNYKSDCHVHPERVHCSAWRIVGTLDFSRGVKDKDNWALM